MSLLFGAVARSIGNITRDFSFNWIVFASVSYNLRASHSPIVLNIRNFSLAATGIITETRAPPFSVKVATRCLVLYLDRGGDEQLQNYLFFIIADELG